jgi:hypothetical protein
MAAAATPRQYQPPGILTIDSADGQRNKTFSAHITYVDWLLRTRDRLKTILRQSPVLVFAFPHGETARNLTRTHSGTAESACAAH